MYMLQLFDKANEVHPLEERLLREGVLRVGRDAAADWTIADPDRAVSRAHCEIVAREHGLSVRAYGSNGVYDDASGDRLPHAVPVDLPLPGAVRLGRYKIVATRARPEPAAMFRPPLGASTQVPVDWADGLSAPRPGDGSLLEAFCRGAGLDGSQLTGEDPAVVMERAGALYRQMVLGIGDLMDERNRARARYQMTRTTISFAGNNPFKWAPTQRLAVDLLLAGPAGFLSGPAALQASLRDIKRHLVASFAGLRASLHAAVDAFDPARVDAAVADRGSLLKSRAALQMEEVKERHADLDRQLTDNSAGSLDEAYLAAYATAERNGA